MAKQQHKTGLIAEENSFAIEQHTIYEENLLPSAEELTKLKQIDKNIIQWILNRAEDEQKIRINYNNGKIKAVHKELSIREKSMWLAFILSMTVLSLSGVFVFFGMDIAGTILGGAGIIIIIQSFLQFGKK